MLSTDPEDLNRLASVHSLSSCEEKPSYQFPWFLDLCDDRFYASVLSLS